MCQPSSSFFVGSSFFAGSSLAGLGGSDLRGDGVSLLTFHGDDGPVLLTGDRNVSPGLLALGSLPLDDDPVDEHDS